MSDETNTLAFPLTVIANSRKAVVEVILLAKKNDVGAVVLGESRDFAGKENPLMRTIERFKKELEEQGMTVVYEPEFLSSAAAARQFAPDGSRKEAPSQEKLDAAAAALILQSYLDRMKNHGGNKL